MRLDKYLKVSRIVKRRTVANQVCDAGKVLVNGKTVKASYNVKLADIIEISLGSHKMKVEVVSLSETVKKEDAVNLYRVIEK